MTLELEPDSLPPARPPSSPRAGVRVGLALLFAGVTIIVCCNRGFNADKSPTPRLDSNRAHGESKANAGTAANQSNRSNQQDQANQANSSATPVAEPTEVIIDEKLYEQGVRTP